jgi:hypothetical protein
VDYLHCNHQHPLTEEHEVVDFGDGEFVANRAAVPLLKALNEAGLRTRTHHHDGGENRFVSILIDPHVHVEIRQVHEGDSTRDKYNGLTELLIQWSCDDR